MNRRKLLATGGGILSLTLAGCASDTDDGNGDREEGSTDDSGNGNGNGNGENNDDGSGDTDSSGNEKQVELLEHEWYNNGQYDAGVSGRLENVSGEELSYVEVSVYFLDEDDTQIGEGLDNTSDLADGRIWEFDAMYTDSDAERVENYEIETDVSNY